MFVDAGYSIEMEIHSNSILFLNRSLFSLFLFRLEQLGESLAGGLQVGDSLAGLPHILFGITCLFDVKLNYSY